MIKKILHAARIYFESALQVRDILALQRWDHAKNTHPNKLCRFGQKYFSQSDEDGLTLEILRRLECDGSEVFVEFGVGNGLENNTLVLISEGWSGIWVGGQELSFVPPESGPLKFIKRWITQESLGQILDELQNNLDSVAYCSLDLDGNDLVFARDVVRRLRPKVMTLEYNGRLGPECVFSIPYDAEHEWDGSDYYGASLAALNEMMVSEGYKLVACNAASGSNAFFVRKEYFALFPEVPMSLRDIYSSPFKVFPKSITHRASPKTILALLTQ